ncbi:MAG: hypothetical protein ACM3U2_18505 [Deltaproteobacteria bacterium]
MQSLTDHLHFYQRYFLEAWNNMSPMEYGFMLVAIAAIGWLCMKSGPR